MFDAFIVACEQYNGGIVESNAEALKSRLNITAGAISGECSRLRETWLSGCKASDASTEWGTDPRARTETSPEPTKTREDLIKFAKANEKQLYRLLKTLLDDQLDVKTLLKNTVRVRPPVDVRRLLIMYPLVPVALHPCVYRKRSRDEFKRSRVACRTRSRSSSALSRTN